MSAKRAELVGNCSDTTIFILVGNKVDLVEERDISWDTCKGFADENNMIYIETSAKTNQGIHFMFTIGTLAVLNELSKIYKNANV